MSYAITNHGTVHAPIHGIGTALRCVFGVDRLLRQRPGKRLQSAHRLFAAGGPQASSLPSASGFDPADAVSSASRPESVCWQSPTTVLPSSPALRDSYPAAATQSLEPAALRAAAAELSLPAAVWATLVVLRATSA